MTDQSITLTARQLRELVNPVLPFAGKDDTLPVLCAVHVRTEGKWLIATATDRFRVGVQRIEKVSTDGDESLVWPELEMVVPTRVIRSILATSKSSRTFDATVTLTVEDGRLVVEMAGAFDLFDSGRFVHHLELGEYPKVGKLIRRTLAIPDADRKPVASFNPAFLSDFKGAAAGRSTTVRVLMGAAHNDPLLVLNDEGFLGMLMPRRSEREQESWDDVFADTTDADTKVGAA